jgi:hypothetical protein
VGGGWQAIARRGDAEAAILPSFAFDFLAACDEFKPLSEHVEDYARYYSLGPEQVREVRHWAEKMIEAGLLISVEELVEGCVAQCSGPGNPARIETIGIPTAGDQQRLRRVIGSFARNAREHGRTVGIALSANGPAGNGPGAAHWIEALGREESVSITLLDDAGRARYGAELAARAGVDPAIAAFALSDALGAGFACGANRNALLLRNAGRAWLSVDDDVVCEMAGPPEPGKKKGLLIFSSRDAFERWFYPGYDAALKAPGRTSCDYLALHERLLGRSVGSFLAAERDIEFVGASNPLARRLRETDGRIVATFTGHFGHPGVPTSYYYLSYRRGTLARLTGAGEEQYRAFLRSGGVRALVPRMAIADASLSPGMAIGIDARELIPPFPPVMHAEDFVWGAALWACHASGFAGHLPVAIRHDPGLGRGILAPPLTGQQPVAMWEFAHILRGMIMAWKPPYEGGQSASRMDSLGRWLQELGDASPRNWRDHLREFVLQHESEKIAFLEQCIAEEEAPDYWRRDVEDYVEQTRLALTARDFEVPLDMRGKWSGDEARELMRRLVLEYGRLLRAWPALMAAAQASGL